MPYKFANLGEVTARLTSEEKLPLEDIREILSRFASSLYNYQFETIHAEIAIHTVDAIKAFDRASRRLTGWLIGLTAGLVALTIVLAYLTFQLVHAPKAREQSEPAPTTIGRPLL